MVTGNEESEEMMRIGDTVINKVFKFRKLYTVLDVSKDKRRVKVTDGDNPFLAHTWVDAGNFELVGFKAVH